LPPAAGAEEILPRARIRVQAHRLETCATAAAWAADFVDGTAISA